MGRGGGGGHRANGLVVDSASPQHNGHVPTMVDPSVVPNALSTSKVLSKTVSPNYAPNTEVGTSVSGQCLSTLGSQEKSVIGSRAATTF